MKLPTREKSNVSLPFDFLEFLRLNNSFVRPGQKQFIKIIPSTFLDEPETVSFFSQDMPLNAAERFGECDKWGKMFDNNINI